MIERGFYAYESSEVSSDHYGSFATAEEAETVAIRLGWSWILVVHRAEDLFGIVTVGKTRFYELEGKKLNRTPSDVQALRRLVVPAPLTEAEVRFFEEYERQMYSGKSKTNPEVTDGKDA